MKRIYSFILLLAVGSTTFVSCGAAKNSTKGIFGDSNSSTVGGTVVKTVATVVGIILLSKIIKSVLGTVGSSNIFGGTTQTEGFAANFNEDTKLSSFVKSDLLKSGLQVLVAEHYQIPLQTVTKNYSNLVTVGDLATFIGQNGSAKSLSAIK